ncbi:MAG: histidine kinase [Acidobacteria bacterium]|nr:histidine kinase [Acidobacteriota bacterium]
MTKPGSLKSRECGPRLKRQFWRSLWLGTALALLVTLVLAWLRAHWSLRPLMWNFAGSFLYTQWIGTPSALAFEWLAPWMWGKRTLTRWALIIALLLTACTLGCLAATFCLHLLGAYPASYFWTAYASGFRISLLISMTMGIGIVLYESLNARLEHAMLALRTQELERERALKQATEARLASLESRVHPHFLFNALNSISALIPEDPKRAERLVEQMAALLRFSLDSNQRGLVPLSQELRIVADYLEIERVRFAERLRYTLDVPAELGETPVPPLALQTLVGNGVKFAVSPRLEGASIRISAERRHGRIRLSVSDDGPGFDATSLPSGHGLDNLQARLETLFAGSARLEIQRENGCTAVSFELPLPGEAAP